MNTQTAPSADIPTVNKWKKWTDNPSVIITIYFLVTIILFIQVASLGKYNNFIIFRDSLQHLIHKLPLYNLYPTEYYDYYLYHPSFPVLFAPFALLPKEVGLGLWLLCSTAIFLYAIWQLPFEKKTNNIIAWFLLVEMSNAIQSSQTNPAMTAFMILAVVHMHRRQPIWAALYTCLCFFIKGYGAVVGIAFLFFPQKGKYLGWCAVWTLIGSALPLLFLSPAELKQEYIDWIQLLTSTTIKEDGSLLGMLHVIGQLPETIIPTFDKIALVIAGIALLWILGKGFFTKNPSYPWLLLAYLLIWIVIFNQSTEAPTYIIALTGTAIACYALPLPQTWRKICLWSLFIITSLSPTELVPPFIHKYAIAWHIKALPCAVILILLQYYIGVCNDSVFIKVSVRGQDLYDRN